MTRPLPFALALVACTGGGGDESTSTDTIFYGDESCSVVNSPPDGSEPIDEADLLSLLAGPLFPEHVVWDEAMDGLPAESDIAWVLTPTGPATRAEISGSSPRCSFPPLLRIPVTIQYDIDGGTASGAHDTFVYATGPAPDDLRFIGASVAGTLELSDALRDTVIDQLEPGSVITGAHAGFYETFLVDPHVAFFYASSYPDYGGKLWSRSGEHP